MGEFEKQNKLSNKTLTYIYKGLTCTIVGLTSFYCQSNPTPEEIQKTRLEQLSNKNKAVFSYFKEGMNLEEYFVEDQEGKKVNVKLLLEESVAGEEAQKYVEKLAEEAYIFNNKKDYKTLESKIALAESIISTARGYIQIQEFGGAGNYTPGYEYNEERERLKKQLIESTDIPEELKQEQWQYLINTKFAYSDSRQTFDEFVKPKDGRILAGDCDDFSIALTTVYHGLKGYAETNKNRDEFFEALTEGLDHYQIFSVRIKDNIQYLGATVYIDHALNISITFGKTPLLEVIEPQIKNKKMQIEIIDGKPYIRETDTYDSFLIKVAYLYNRDFSAEAKKEEPK
ncbi:MAG: hypothetical protein V1914_02195 [archaeon]